MISVDIDVIVFFKKHCSVISMFNGTGYGDTRNIQLPHVLENEYNSFLETQLRVGI